MAERPDGKSARTERVAFTRPAAERISRVVRTVEAGDRSGAALRFQRVGTGGGGGRGIRICTFTGSWSIGSSKSVTFKGQTATPNTASVTNLFFPITQAPASAKDCAIARDGTAWYLIDVPFRVSTVTNITDISASLNTASCTITVNKTTATASYLQLDL